MAEQIEIDARAVLEKYVALMREVATRQLQPIRCLPAPKHIIKEVLLHVMRNAPSGMDIAPMKLAYLNLSAFQDVEGAANQTLDAWTAEMGSRTDPSMSNEEMQRAADQTVSVRGFLDDIQKRVGSERKALADELTAAGF